MKKRIKRWMALSMAGMLLGGMLTAPAAAAGKESLVGIREDRDTETETETEKETEAASNGHRVCIDAGHQDSSAAMEGEEPIGPGASETKAKTATGTEGPFSGMAEYELNLGVSLALQEELESRGYEVVMTRVDHSTSISNIERAQLASDEGAEIMVRIHANGSDDSSVSGALSMVPSPENPYVADLYEDSYALGEEILNAYCTSTGIENLGVQYYDNMTGINWSTVPVTILEMGFMTNQSDDLLMTDESFWPTMAEGIADGIDAYFAQKDDTE